MIPLTKLDRTLICRDCGSSFLPDAAAGGDCCPECGGGRLMPGGRCSVCDRPLPAGEADSEEGCGLCPECRRAAVSFFRLYLGRYFTRAEINYLNRVYDGRDLGEGIEETTL